MYSTLFDDPGTSSDRMLPRYLAVTPEAIRDVAAAISDPDNRLVLTYLPGSERRRCHAAGRRDGRGRRRRGGGRMTSTVDPHAPRRAGRRRAALIGRAPRVRPGRQSSCPGQWTRRSSWSTSPAVPLISASMVVIGGAVEEPHARAGATVLAARALTEGTDRYDAIALVEAPEQLGASLHAEAGWDALTVGVDVSLRPAGARPWTSWPRCSCARPSRPPKSSGSVMSGSTTCCRPRPTPAGGSRRRSSARSTPPRRPTTGLRAAWRRRGLARTKLSRATYEATLHPSRATLIVGGDLGGQDVVPETEAPVRRLGRRGP